MHGRIVRVVWIGDGDLRRGGERSVVGGRRHDDSCRNLRGLRKRFYWHRESRAGFELPCVVCVGLLVGKRIRDKLRRGQQRQVEEREAGKTSTRDAGNPSRVSRQFAHEAVTNSVEVKTS